MKLQIVFQGKGVGDSEDSTKCTCDRVLMNPGDMKALKIRLGSYVPIHLVGGSKTEMLCKAWYSKKNLPAGSATLNKSWMVNFSDNNRKVEAHSPSNYR